MADLALLPTGFEELREHLPEGFSLSERVVDPVILLDRENCRLSARLAGRRVVRSAEIIMPAPSNDHAWVIDGSVLRPLPADIPSVLTAKFASAEATDMSYADALALIRGKSDEILVKAAGDVLHAGKIVAETLPSTIEIDGLNADLFPYQARGVQ